MYDSRVKVLSEVRRGAFDQWPDDVASVTLYRDREGIALRVFSVTNSHIAPPLVRADPGEALCEALLLRLIQRAAAGTPLPAGWAARTADALMRGAERSAGSSA